MVTRLTAKTSKKSLGDMMQEFSDLKDQGRCPFCSQHVVLDDFRDNISKREFQISGLCQACQDDVYGA